MQSALSRFTLRRGTALRVVLLAGFLCGGLAIHGQTSSGTLGACKCADIPRLKDRLQKLLGIQKLIARKLQTVGASAPATQTDWDNLQTQINAYLRALQVQSLTDFPDTSLFPGADPSCSVSSASAATCSEQEFALHEQGHAASCSAGRWSWQSPWRAAAMLREESTALEAEIDAIKDAIDHLPCASCPQFIVTVQVVTTTAINQSGLNERSGRSLNNGQGIQIPLTMQSNGTFQGFGSGIDAGSAMGSTRGETVSGQFGHMQSIYATGSVQAASCGTPPCPRDMMHLTLSGGPAQQITEMQARGEVNRNLNQNTPTGGATLTFDLPAYMGATAQRTLLANSIINSVMQVTLSQVNTGSGLLPDGSSVLYSLQECRGPIQIADNNPPPSNPPPKLPGGSQPGGGSGGSGGGGSPGLPPHVEVQVNEAISLSEDFSSPVLLNLAEHVGVKDAVQSTIPIPVLVNENITVSDTVPGEVALNISEKVHVGGALQFPQSIPVVVNEAITVTDAIPAEVVLNIAESVRIRDTVVTQP